MKSRMIFRATVSQTAFILRKKGSVCVFYVLLYLVLANFIENILAFQGRDVMRMVHPMRMLLLSYDRTNYNATNTLTLIQLYPLLVVCPAGFSLAREHQLETRVFLVSRLGKTAYLVSKFLAVFLATMLVFTVPFLLEILLNCLSFPLSATNTFGNASSLYDSRYREEISHYLMKDIYRYSPYLYAVVGTLLFGAASGLLAVFTAAVSSLKKVKYTVFLFLPVYVLCQLSTILNSKFPKGVPSIRWYDFLLIFDDKIKYTGCFAIGIAAIVYVSIRAVIVGGRKDCL